MFNRIRRELGGLELVSDEIMMAVLGPELALEEVQGPPPPPDPVETEMYERFGKALAAGAITSEAILAALTPHPIGYSVARARDTMDRLIAAGRALDAVLSEPERRDDRRDDRGAGAHGDPVSAPRGGRRGRRRRARR